jgi:hypothetical protein
MFKNISNIPGIRIKQRTIIICSDDWGSMRVDSREARDELIKSGIDMDGNRFDRYDILECNKDMEDLFEVLLAHCDCDNHHPVFTAVTNVCNPDFKKIKENKFEHYFYIDLKNTHENYTGHEKVFELYKQGIELGIFIPQSHGREHLNTGLWMKALQGSHETTLKGFGQKYFMFNPRYLSGIADNGFGAAFYPFNQDLLAEHCQILSDGLDIFKDMFNYNAVYFTAPSGIFSDQLDQVLIEKGIRLIDVQKLRKMPLGNGRLRYKLHFMGQRNRYSQFYITRNAVFEPNMNKYDDGVDSCLYGISQAFKWSKPAVISNHRAAFVGGLDAGNRAKGLKSLSRLFNEIKKRWPDVRYKSMADLYKIIAI